MLIAAIALAGPLAFAPRAAFAENLFDLLFGGVRKQLQQASFFADPSSADPQAPRVASTSGPAFCVRSCDGKYFPLAQGAASPVQMCQAFCPASPTKVFFGSSIDNAYAAGGERYADSKNAFAFRKALRADCTCNGRDSVGLAPVDIALDSSLRSGDVIATTDGPVVYSGVKVGNSQTAEFTPVASYTGLAANVRTQLRGMKVAPARAETANAAPISQANRDVALPANSLPRTTSPKAKRAEVN